MSTELDALFQGVEGAERPSQAGMEDTSVSDVSDMPTACQIESQQEQGHITEAEPGGDPAPADSRSDGGAKRRRRGSPHLDTRYDVATLDAVRTRAKRLGLDASAWVRATVRDALDVRRSEELDAAVAAHLLGVEARVQASADALELAAQVRPLAINVNDLDRRARAGEPVALSADVPELIELLREVRALLGDRTAS